jgi:NAD(P) transhydrogenase subunit alpha
MTTPLLTLLFADAAAAPEDAATKFIRLLTVFLLAMWVGFEVITKVPQRLHTPLTSGSNAISGITAVGAIVAAGAVVSSAGSLFGLVALFLAMINVAGGFVVTYRMLQMFNPKKK